MKKKYVFLLLFVFIFLTSFACKHENDVTPSDNSDEVTQTNENEEKVKHAITEYDWEYQAHFDFITYKHTPFYNRVSRAVYYETIDEFDNFMNLISKENQYDFIVPLIVNDEIYSIKSIMFALYSDYETMLDQVEMEFTFINGEPINAKPPSFEVSGYDYVTEYNKLECNLHYYKDKDPNNTFPFNFAVIFTTHSGSSVLNYYKIIEKHTGKKFDIYDQENFFYDEERYYGFKNYNDPENTTLVDVFSRTEVYSNEIFNAQIDIYVYLGDLKSQINETLPYNKELLEEIKPEINRIYDYVYQSIQDYGYATYHNVN